MKTATLIFGFSLFCHLSWAQGAIDGFLKGRGNLDMALTGAYQHSTKYYDGLGLYDYERSLTIINLFGEFGITDNWDVLASIPMINWQFQDAGIHTKYGFNLKVGKSNLRLIPAGGISFPISKYEPHTGQAIGQRATQIQPRMVVQFDGKRGYFIQAQGGYNYALDPVPSSMPLSAKIGIYRSKIYADVWLDYQKGIGGKAWHVDPISSFRELFVTHTRVGGVFYYAPKPTYGFFINGSYVLDGVNIGKAITLGAGFVYKLDFY